MKGWPHLKVTSALQLAGQGFRVFPLLPNGKKPAIDEWPTAATTDRQAIVDWWKRNKDYNIGVATGGGFFVVDVDTKKGRPGLDSLDSLETFYDLPASYRVTTPSGGLHVYLRKPESTLLVSNANKVQGHPGLDIRAEGGFVVGPGSTIDGVAYAATDTPLDDAPDCVFPLLSKPTNIRDDASSIELDLQPNIGKTIDYLVNRAPGAQEGAGGDETTFSVAAECRALGVSEHMALELMLEHWNEQKASPPWPPEDLAKKVENAFQYGQGAAGGKTAAGEFGALEIDIGEPPVSATKAHAENPTTGAKAPRLVKASDFAPLEKPERDFLVQDLIPHKNVTMLGGDGATGKSLLAMQLSLAAATSTRWIGKEVREGPVLYFSAEDDEDETHIRLKDICASNNVDLSTVDNLHIALMAGEDALLAIENVQGASMKKTPLFGRLRQWMTATRPVLLVLDNLADIFGGNENVKSTARQFVGMLRGLAIEFDCSVLLLSHPSLSGMASGTGTSGNVAWNNSVRSRLYLQRDKTDDGIEIDPDRRVLEVKKANYAGVGQTIDIRWEQGRFVGIDIPELDDVEDGEQAESKMQKAERVFMEMVERFNHERRNVSPSLGANYAPTVFARHPKACGVAKTYLEIAMNNLLEKSVLRVETVGPPSKQRQNIVFARDASNGLPTPSNATC